MKNNYLFLDDIRMPIEAYSYTNFAPFLNKEWDIVRDYNEFISYITKNGMPDFIAFDHDLGEEHYKSNDYWDQVYKSNIELEEKTGFDCAKWLVEYCIDNNKKLPEYYVHSMNPVGKRNIIEYLENFRKHENK